MTPEEAWNGRKPVVNYFKIFGCIAYAHIPDEKRKKLDEKAEKCVFLGRCFFDEENTWDWDGQRPCSIIVDSEAEIHQPIDNVTTQLNTSPVTPGSPIAATEPKRTRRRPAWMSDYEITGINQIEDPSTHFALFSDCDPTTFESAIKEEKWRKAMNDEIDALKRNDTWELVDLPKVARHDTIRLVVALAAQNSWPIFQLDVKSAFLHGYLDEQVFVEQPPGYIKTGNEHKVYRLNKALYGLKQAPRAWYSRIEAYFLKVGFSKCPYEHTLFVKIGKGGKMLIVCLYVDDLIFTGNCDAMFQEFKKCMMDEFEMSDLGKMHYFLSIEVVNTSDGIFISQKKYIGEILDRFLMKDCNAVSTPTEFGLKLNKDYEGKKDSTLYKQIVGSLMYLTATRPDIMYSVSLISRYMENPTEMHLLGAKRILRYLQGTRDYGLFYRKGEKPTLLGFTDSDYAGDQDDRRSTSGYVFMLGTGAISWSSKKQRIVTFIKYRS
ncbi:UNVERIFIED_CONTAM: Retrovirus-related Pol polyprotein from transposon TNT 1-94 [Sesamum radiatum]|uniref:Retrovirus-related Pol polyprotein from transposon TNT 1-94 n=1 Tax=Sesamum radiatum TaxID=300843 RepID=A0AAW2PXC8_SESRA